MRDDEAAPVGADAEASGPRSARVVAGGSEGDTERTASDRDADDNDRDNDNEFNVKQTVEAPVAAPVMLRTPVAPSIDAPATQRSKADSISSIPRGPMATQARKRDVAIVTVVGFWRRLGAALIDLAVILPASVVVIWIASKLTGVRVPRGLDFWLDLILASDPALLMALGLTLAVAAVYLLVFQILQARTLGMRLLRMRVIDIYGDPPSPARCVARTLGYLGGVFTLFLGFLWVGFDREKRGLHDFIAGTYVIRG